LEDDPPVDDDFELDLEAVDVVSSAQRYSVDRRTKNFDKEIFCRAWRGYR
jgi:hypothetical protein